MNFWRRPAVRACPLPPGMAPPWSPGWRYRGPEMPRLLTPNLCDNPIKAGCVHPAAPFQPCCGGGRVGVRPWQGSGFLLTFLFFLPVPPPLLHGHALRSWSPVISLSLPMSFSLWDSLSLFFLPVFPSLCFCHSSYFFLCLWVFPCLSLTSVCLSSSLSLPVPSDSALPFSDSLPLSPCDSHVSLTRVVCFFSLGTFCVFLFLPNLPFPVSLSPSLPFFLSLSHPSGVSSASVSPSPLPSWSSCG